MQAKSERNEKSSLVFFRACFFGIKLAGNYFLSAALCFPLWGKSRGVIKNPLGFVPYFLKVCYDGIITQA